MGGGLGNAATGLEGAALTLTEGIAGRGAKFGAGMGAGAGTGDGSGRMEMRRLKSKSCASLATSL